jgi:hypothetical protein
MVYVMIRLVGAAAATMILLAGVASPAAAAHKNRSELTLSYLADAGYAAAVVLRCEPSGGAHPKKGKACKALAKVGGDPAKLVPKKGVVCTLEHDPVTAEITGHWRSQKIYWSQTFGNPCEMRRATGVVLAF